MHALIAGVVLAAAVVGAGLLTVAFDRARVHDGHRRYDWSNFD